MSFSFLEGNEAVAWGAMYAGCRFFAGYPITPATTILDTMLKLLPPVGGICIQGEDEIASIGYCLGASMAGFKAMTATSGPGLSLCSEQISFAIGSEIPVVIVDVQRLGPSTGSATRGADGDIQFLQWGNSGGMPVIVLAPVTAQDCFTLTVQAFNLAEKYRCPVFLASSKEIAMTRESVDPDAASGIEILTRRPPETFSPYLPFDTPDGQTVPGFLPIGGDVPVRQTSSTHGPDGYLTADPEVISRMQDRLRDKILSDADRFSFYDIFSAEGADTLIIAYGVTARAAREVFETQKQAGKPVSLLVLKTLWPVPEKAIRDAAQNYQRILVVEMNLGQYVREIRRVLPDRKTDFFGQMNGKLITPQQIRRALEI